MQITIQRKVLLLLLLLPLLILSVHGFVYYPSTRQSSCLSKRKSTSKNTSSPQYISSKRRVAISFNKKLVELGKQRQWEALLEYAHQERKGFDSVNCSTLMSQLGRIRSFDESDPRFQSFLRASANMIEQHGLSWIDTQGAANVIHALGKMKLMNQTDARRILDWISRPEVTAQLVKDGNPQVLANTA